MFGISKTSEKKYSEQKLLELKHTYIFAVPQMFGTGAKWQYF